MFKAKTIRKTYGKPWSKIISEAPLNKEVMKALGEILVKHVVYEARKDLARQGNKRTPYKQPEGLPVSERFFDSFGHQLEGESTIAITSTWPWIEQIVEGRGKYRMEWLTRENGVGIVPLRPEPGVVLFRWAPATKSDAWIHPGFAKHNFLERAIRRAKKDLSQKLADEILLALSKEKNPLLE